MEDLQSGGLLGAIGAVQKAGVAVNTYKNPQNLLNIAKGEVIGMVGKSIAGQPNRNANFNFPTAADAVNTATGAINSGYKKAVDTIIKP